MVKKHLTAGMLKFKVLHNVYKYVIVLYHNFIVHLIVTTPLLLFFTPLHRINGGTIQQKQFMRINDIDETFN